MFLLSPLFLALAASPWVFGAPLGGALTTTLLAALLFLGVFLVTRPRTLSFPVPRSGRLRLVTRTVKDPHHYCVYLGSEDGSEQLVLEHPDPAVVLEEAQRLARDAGLEIEAGWGLPPEALRDVAPDGAGDRGASVRAGSVVGWRFPWQPEVGGFVLFGGTFELSVFLWVLFHTRSEASGLALALPLLTVLSLFLMSAWLFSARTRVQASREGLRVERVILGRGREILRLPVERIRSAHAVSPQADPPRHLLLLTGGGPISLHLTGEAARRAAELVLPHVDPGLV